MVEVGNVHYPRMKSLVIIAVLGIPLLINYISTSAPGGFSDIGVPAGRGAGILQGEVRDIDGDGEEEVLRLMTEPGEYFLLKGLRLEVQDSGGNLTIPIESDGYATATLNIVQINGTPEQEVFVTLLSSGGRGHQDLYGFKIRDGEYQRVFSPADYLKSEKFELKYLGEKRISFTDLTTGFSFELDLSDNPNYADFTKTEIQRMYNVQKSWTVDDYSGFSWADLDEDGVKEIIGSRKVSGMTRTDLIGTLQEYYRLEGEVFQPYAQAFFAPGGQEVAGQSIKRTQNQGEQDDE